MATTNPSCFHLSASAISSFKACPTRYRLAYREGLRVAEDTDAQRVGTNWHALHEAYYDAYCSRDSEQGDPSDQALEAAVDHLNERYAAEAMPGYKTIDEWEVERQQLLISFIGYLWYWQDDPLEVLASEVSFDLPLIAPKVGLPLPKNEVLVVGKIDHVVKWRGMVGNVERKSTSRGIDPSGDYWDKAKKDTQVSMYALAFRDMVERDSPPVRLTTAEVGECSIGNTLYDVWHKPTIKPTKLTQADTATLIAAGEYCGVVFEVKVGPEDPEKPGDGPRVTVDGVDAEVHPGKKGFAIRETPAMYGARLLNDIYERPEFYFQRKEIARSDADLKKFRVELFNIYQAQRLFDTTGCWYENEQQCRATFPCPFIPICYGPGADAVCDGETTPDEFKRIFENPAEAPAIEGD